jgi:transcriptional/translational regulatory protein YebC/TACO1
MRPGGVAMLVEAMTNNRNRTVAEVRHAFSKRGGNLGTDGSVAYLFSRKGQLSLAPGCDEEQVWMSPSRPVPRTWRPLTTVRSK